MLRRRGDYYDLLQVPRGAGDAQIKRSYRKLALKYHPVRYRKVLVRSSRQHIGRPNWCCPHRIKSPEPKMKKRRQLRSLRRSTMVRLVLLVGPFGFWFEVCLRFVFSIRDFVRRREKAHLRSLWRGRIEAAYGPTGTRAPWWRQHLRLVGAVVHLFSRYC